MAKEKDCPKCEGTGKIPDDIGVEMRALRRKAKYSLAGLARRLKCHKTTLSRKENGFIPWTREWIERYEKICLK